MRFRTALYGFVLLAGGVALSFSEANVQSTQVGNNPRGLAVGDVDADGQSELVVANFGAPSFIGQDLPASQLGSLQVFSRSGSSLALKAESSVGAGPRGVAVLPDGHIVVSLYGENLLKTFFCKSGHLTETQSIPVAARPVGLAAGNGVVAVASYGEPKVSIFGLGPNDLLGEKVELTTLPGTTAVAIGRMFGRSLPEVVVACLASDKVLVLSSDTSALSGYRIEKTLSLPQGTGPADLRLEDVDGDGTLDIIAVLFGGKSVAVFQQKVAGSFESPVITKLAGASPNGLTVVSQGKGLSPLVAVAERDSDLVEMFVWESGRLEPVATLPLEATPTAMGPVEIACLSNVGASPLWVVTHMRSGTLRMIAQGSITTLRTASPVETPTERVTPTPEPQKQPLSDQTTLLFPNPLRGKGQVTIQYTVDEALPVEVRIFDLMGRLVWNQTVPAGMLGTNQLVWDARNSASVPVASGAYVCRIASGSRVVTKKVFIIR
jgi:hypothetical protein